MLNWIAIWVTQALVGQGGQLQNSTDKSVPVSSDIAQRRPPAGLLGRPGAPGAAHRVLHRARRARRLLAAAQPDDPRLRGAGDGLQPGGGPVRRRQREAQLRRWRWRSPARSPGSPARSTSSAGSSGSACSTSRSRRSASSGSPSRCSGATRRSACPLAALLFGALTAGHLDAESGDPGRDQAGARREPDDDHPGPRAAVRRRRPALPLDLAAAEEGSAARRPPRLHRQQERPHGERALTCRPGSGPLRGDREVRRLGRGRARRARPLAGAAARSTLRSPVVVVRARGAARRSAAPGRPRAASGSWAGARWPRPASARCSPTAPPCRASRTSTAPSRPRPGPASSTGAC